MDKRLQIMQAAEKLFTSRRFHEVTTDDIAKSAHVGKGTIYNYFQDKDDLFFQMATNGFDELCDLLHAKVSIAGPFTEQLLQAVEQIHKFFQRRRQMLRLMHGDGIDGRCAFHKRWQEHRGRLLSAVSQIMSLGAKTGEIRDDVPPDVLATLLLGMLRIRARELNDQPERSCSIELLVQLFCNGAAKPLAAKSSANKRKI